MYNKPIESNIFTPGDWNKALPIGNGYLGGMIFGGVSREFIQLNEESNWYKGETNRINKDALNNISKIQELVLNGEIEKAEKLIELALHSTPAIQGHYEPLSNVIIKFFHDDKNITKYKRELDLNHSCVKIDYVLDNDCYHREYFASYVDKIICGKFTTDSINGLEFYIMLNRDKSYDGVYIGDNGEINLIGSCGGKNGTKYCCSVICHTDGIKKVVGDKIYVTKATYAFVYIAGSTDFRKKSPEYENQQILSNALHKGYAKIKEDHIRDYQYLFNRVNFSMGESHYDVKGMLDNIKNGKEELSLIPLYYQFVRYLMISCSRAHTLPANLQGIWNKDYQPAWDSKYTININTEMNYWPVETSNLSECHLPLFDLLEIMFSNGKNVAKNMYGCKGFVAHHNTDPWGDCAPQGMYISSSQWNLGAAWLCTHIYEHYLYTKDKDFLKHYYYLMKEACLFILDFLVEDNHGQLVTCPSLSPENSYYGKDQKVHHICYAPTSDIQIIRELFTDTLLAIKELNQDDELLKQLQEALLRLPKMKVGKYGQLQEWIEDYDEVEPGHRHMAHLLGLYPFRQIDIKETPNLAQASLKTIQRRAFYGQQNGQGWLTGWARAWMISIWARLCEGNHAMENLQEIFKTYTSENLFDLHPPFQIDGNFGVLAGINEMLVQSFDDKVLVLPALPESWKSGEITGLKIKGGHTIDILWTEKDIDIKIMANENADLQLYFEQAYKNNMTIDGEKARMIHIKKNTTYKYHVCR